MFSIFYNFSSERQHWEQPPLLHPSLAGVTADIAEPPV